MRRIPIPKDQVREKPEPLKTIAITEDVGVRIWASRAAGRLTASNALSYKPFPTRNFRRRSNSTIAKNIGLLSLAWLKAWKYMEDNGQDCPPIPVEALNLIAQLETTIVPPPEPEPLPVEQKE